MQQALNYMNYIKKVVIFFLLILGKNVTCDEIQL